MYSMNKTDEWIASLPATEKAETIQQAKVMASATIEKYKSRKQLVRQRITDKLKRKKLEQETADVKRAMERRQIIDEVSKLGGEWNTTEQCDQFIESSSTNARPALLWQLKYHKKVLQTPVTDRTLFQQQIKGKVLTNNELCKNLKTVIALAAVSLLDAESPQQIRAARGIVSGEERKKNSRLESKIEESAAGYTCEEHKKTRN